MSADNESVWALLTSFTSPDPKVQTDTLAKITQLSQSWAPLPYTLAEFLAHGSPSASSAEEKMVGQQAAGSILKQCMADRLAMIKAVSAGQTPAVSYPQLDLSAFDVPLLFAICSGDKKVQVAASTCLSQLVHYASELAKAMAKNNADGAAAASGWITSLITKLEQLVQSDNVANNHLGVSRCLGVLMEDRNQDLLSETRHAAAEGHDTEEHASAALVQRLDYMVRFVVPVYRLLGFLVTHSNALPAKLNALTCIGGINFVLGDDDLLDDDSQMAVKGKAVGGAHHGLPNDPKAARAELATRMHTAERELVAAVAHALPAIVAEAQQGADATTEEGVRSLLDSFTAAINALVAVSSHWNLVQHLAIAVLPTVLQWLAVFDWRQQQAKAPAVGHLVIDPAILRASSFEAEGLRLTCLEFITELAQMIENDTEISDALTEHHAAILTQLYAASVLDEMAVSEVCIEADRHVPDEMSDVLFKGRSRNKGQHEGGEHEHEDDDVLHDDAAGDDEHSSSKCSSPMRQAAMRCFGAMVLILPPAFIFAVTGMLFPVVQRHLGEAPNSDWLELEGAMAFLAEVLANAPGGACDDDEGYEAKMAAMAEQVGVICCRFLGMAQSGDGFAAVAPHFAGPVRAAAARVLARIGERFIMDNSPDDGLTDDPAEAAAYAQRVSHQNLILDTIVTVLHTTTVHDANKAVLTASIGALASILQHSLIAQYDEDEDEDEDEDDGGAAGAAAEAEEIAPFVHVGNAHLANFYGLTTVITSMPLSQRVCYYNLVPDIAKADVEVLGRHSPFLAAVEAMFTTILAAWKQLVPQLDSYESLAIGDFVCELMQVLTKDTPSRQLPAACARALWNDIGVTVFQTSGIAQNLLRGVDESGLTTECVSVSTDILSGICDTADPAVTAELFSSTGIASVIASIVLPNLSGSCGASPSEEKRSQAAIAKEELVRATLGLLGDFCGIVPADQVHAVADALVSPIAHVLAEEAGKVNGGNLTLSADGKAVTKTYPGGLKVTSVGGYDLADLVGGERGEDARIALGNTLWCLAKLLETVSTGDDLLRVCPTALASPAQLQSLIGSCTVLLKILSAGTSDVTKLNLLVVTSKLGSLFPAVLDAVGGTNVLLSSSHTLASVEDLTEKLTLGLSIGSYFGSSGVVQQRAGSDIKVRGLILSLALALAPAIKKCMAAARSAEAGATVDKKGKPLLGADVIAKGQKVHAMWAPMVSMCHDAAATAHSAKHSTAMKASEKALMQQVYMS